jgi:hypothetical protein
LDPEEPNVTGVILEIDDMFVHLADLNQDGTISRIELLAVYRVLSENSAFPTEDDFKISCEHVNILRMLLLPHTNFRDTELDIYLQE